MNRKIKAGTVFLVLILTYLAYCNMLYINDHTMNKGYTFRVFTILYGSISISSVLIIDLKMLQKRDLAAAIVLGLLSVGIHMPLDLLGILTGITVFFSYLVGKKLAGFCDERMVLFHKNGFLALGIDFAIIFLAGAAFLIALSDRHLETGKLLDVGVIFNAVSAGVSEEIIFRMFFFSLCMYLAKGKKIPKAIVFIVLMLPFAMLHIIDKFIYFGWLSTIPDLISICGITAVLILLAWKRDIFTAIGVHFMYDYMLSIFR